MRSVRHTPWIIVGLAASATLAYADEDARKLASKQPPVFGPIVTANDLKNGNVSGPTDGPFPSKGITFLSWIPIDQMSPTGNSAADMWGYVSPGGHEYAIIGISNGHSFVRVTDPVNPQIVGFLPGPNSLWHDVTVVGKHAYAGSEGGSGVQVMDMTNIDSGTVTLVKNWQANGHSSTHTLLSNEQTKFLYACGANIANGGLIPIDISDPINPKFVLNGSGQPIAWTTSYVHECQVVSYNTGPYAGKEIAFLYRGNSSGISIVDVTNKQSLVTMSTIAYAGLSYSHQGWVTDDKKYLYQNDELDENGTNTTTTRVFDITNLSAPVLVKTFTNGSTAIDHNLYIKGNTLFCGNYRSGLRVWDITTPLSPVEKAWIDTWPSDDAAEFNGVWGNYPLFPSGTIGISDIEKGLVLVRYGALNLTLVGAAPTQLAPNTPVPITVAIVEDQVTLDPTSVKLNVSVNGGAYTAYPMSASGSFQFTGNLPGASCFDEVTYYVSAKSTQGFENTAPEGGPIAAKVYTGANVLFTDDMQTNKGWATSQPGDTATTGIWNRMDPQATAAQPEDDHTAAPGTFCWVTDGNAGGSVGAFDVDNGKTTLLSPVINLASGDATISYWRWYNNSAGGNPGIETFVVSISNNNGSTWVPVETLSGSQTGGWQFKEFKVSQFVPPTAQVRVRFVAKDDIGAVVEAAVDDFDVKNLVCDAPSCYPDCDGSGDLSIDDFICFQTFFALGDPFADCDADSALTIDDFICFQTFFALGC